MLFRLFWESFASATAALVENKLRTFLSLLGIVIGIFSIISVLTMVDALNGKITDSVKSLGDDVIYVQKWPWEFGKDYPWWKYMNRPLPKPEELTQIRRRLQVGEAAAFTAGSNRTVKYGSLGMNGVYVMGVSDDYDRVSSFEIAQGRYFTQDELAAGRAVCIVGDEVVKNIFGLENPLGKMVSVKGLKMQVIGVFKRQGDNMFGNSTDTQLLTTLGFARNLMNIKKDNANPYIVVKARKGISNAALQDELEGIMRDVRRTKPGDEGNFALNQTSLLSKGFAGLFGIVNGAGWIIGLFSILVGGFGIANIMFVSVKERTNIIGIKKSLGAKNFFILFEFLFESVILCLIGGLIGLVLIYFATLGINAVSDFGVALTLKNINVALLISLIVGIFAGIVPAWSASRLSPVDAIRSK